MSALKDQLTADMKDAMRARDKDRLGVLRLILAAVKQVEVDERVELDDDRIQGLLTKMVKQRNDSISQYESADRQDLADKEKAEIEIIASYRPEQLDEERLRAIVVQAIADTGASSPQEMGKVMKVVKEQTAGRADMGLVSGLVKSALTGG